jgi:hypothetical protein
MFILKSCWFDGFLFTSYLIVLNKYFSGIKYLLNNLNFIKTKRYYLIKFTVNILKRIHLLH